MKKFLVILGIFILAMVATGVLSWVNKAKLAAYFMARELHVPVKIESLDMARGKTDIAKLWIGNPSHSQTPTAFSSEKIGITATWGELFGNPLTIEDIVIEDIFVGLEYYDGSGIDNNWAKILRQEHKVQKTEKDYIIKRLVVRNLTVQLTKANGKVQRFPAIDEMVFYNITSETGFPIQDVEKAILDIMMQGIFKRLGLEQLLDTIVPGGSPLKYLPRVPFIN